MLVRAASAQTGQLDASSTLFTVMAALNAAGYDADLDSPNNSPLRKAVRAELANRQIPSLASLKTFLARHRKPNPADDLSQYVSFALTASPAPDFAIRQPNVDIPPDVVPFKEFSPLLAAFYREANIEQLWKSSQPAIEQFIAPYHQGVLEAVLQVNAYLRQPTSGVRGMHFQIFLEPLMPPGQVQTRRYGAEFTVVISPSPQPRINEVRHAYLYYLLDPLATRNKEILERKKPLADHAMRAALLGDAYKQDFLLLATGSLVRAVEARMDNKPDAQTALKEGYVLAPYFFEALAAFEKQEASMMLYYTSMVQAIDLLKEDKRLLPVIFAEKPAAPAETAPAADPKTATPPIYEALNQAEALLKDHKLDQAESIFQEAANQSGNQRVEAAGYYGLARIALVQGEHEDGETLLQKALELEPEGQIKARVLIDLGQLRLEVMDNEQAARYFQQALHVEGATEAAHREAMQGLDKSLQKIKKN